MFVIRWWARKKIWSALRILVLLYKLLDDASCSYIRKDLQVLFR